MSVSMQILFHNWQQLHLMSLRFLQSSEQHVHINMSFRLLWSAINTIMLNLSATMSNLYDDWYNVYEMPCSLCAVQ